MKLYDQGYPITFKELQNKISDINWTIINNKFHQKIKLLLDAALPKICANKLKFNNTSFQLFGVDFIVTNEYETRILEVNIGPGMEPYSHSDKSLRYKLHTDMLSVIGVLNNKNFGGFTPLI